MTPPLFKHGDRVRVHEPDGHKDGKPNSWHNRVGSVVRVPGDPDTSGHDLPPASSYAVKFDDSPFPAAPFYTEGMEPVGDLIVAAVAVDEAAQPEPEAGVCPGCGQSYKDEHLETCSIAFADTPTDDLVHPQGKRRIFYVDDTMHTPNGFVPALVTEDEPGFSPMIGQGELAQPWYWGHDLDTAKGLAAKANAERGISEADAHDILISSIVASNKQQAASERWEAIKQGRG